LIKKWVSICDEAAPGLAKPVPLQKQWRGDRPFSIIPDSRQGKLKECLGEMILGLDWMRLKSPFHLGRSPIYPFQQSRKFLIPLLVLSPF
jgi:hypothetical protein